MFLLGLLRLVIGFLPGLLLHANSLGFSDCVHSELLLLGVSIPSACLSSLRLTSFDVVSLQGVAVALKDFGACLLPTGITPAGCCSCYGYYYCLFTTTGYYFYYFHFFILRFNNL